MSELPPPDIYIEEASFRARLIAGAKTSTAGFIGFIPNLPDARNDTDTSVSASVLLPTPVIGDPKRIQAQKITLPAMQTTKLYTSLDEFTRDYGDLIGDPKADDARNAAQAQVDQATGDAKIAALAALALRGPSVLDKTATVDDFAPGMEKRKTLDAWRNLTHALHGFFYNGGSRCYVINAGDPANLQSVLDNSFTDLREIAIIAAPGLTISFEQDKLVAHCQSLANRIAVLDPQPVSAHEIANSAAIQGALQDSSYAAMYFPYLRAFDPTTQLLQQAQEANNVPKDGGIFIGPCGHIAGVYARVDAARGVFKAPTNEPILGITALQYNLSTTVQGKLNQAGINALRVLNGQIRVWGARTLGANNDEFTYVSTRRYVNFLHESLLEGTQWVVFEPNTPALWQRLTEVIGDFLFTEWQNGGLLGAKPQQAFFVRCDATTNTTGQIAQGIVTILIGVALIKPAEFILFRLQLRSG